MGKDTNWSMKFMKFYNTQKNQSVLSWNQSNTKIENKKFKYNEVKGIKLIWKNKRNSF